MGYEIKNLFNDIQYIKFSFDNKIKKSILPISAIERIKYHFVKKRIKYIFNKMNFISYDILSAFIYFAEQYKNINLCSTKIVYKDEDYDLLMCKMVFKDSDINISISNPYEKKFKLTIENKNHKENEGYYYSNYYYNFIDIKNPFDEKLNKLIVERIKEYMNLYLNDKLT